MWESAYIWLNTWADHLILGLTFFQGNYNT